MTAIIQLLRLTKNHLYSTSTTLRTLFRPDVFDSVDIEGQTAGNNHGGPDNDFGNKYNVWNDRPAPENVASKIYEKTKSISLYKATD
jgi:hypothetical protein